MQRSHLAVLTLLFLLAAPVLAGCGDDDGDNGGPDSTAKWDMGFAYPDGGVPVYDGSTGDGQLADAPASSEGAPPGDGATVDLVGGPISLMDHVQPLFTFSCAQASCHRGGTPAGGLNLNSGNSYDYLVNVAAVQCPSLFRVKPGSVIDSYLVQKIEGTGSCFTGDKMPVGGSLQPNEINLIKAWIAGGALEY